MCAARVRLPSELTIGTASRKRRFRWRRNCGVARCPQALTEKPNALTDTPYIAPVAELIGLLQASDADQAARVAAARDLGAIGGDAAIEALAAALHGDIDEVSHAAIEALGAVGAAAAASGPALASLLLASDTATRPTIVRALARVDPSYAVPVSALAGEVCGEGAPQRPPPPQDVLDNVPALVGHMGPDRRYTYVNRAYSDWAGKPAREIVGLSVRDLFGNVVYEGIADQIQAAFEGQTVEFDNRVTFHGERPRDVRVRYIPDRAPSGEVRGIYVLLSDVTDLTRTLAALRASEARLQRLLQSVPDTIMRADPDGVILDFASPRHPDPARFIGKPVSDFVPGAEHQQMKQATRQAIATGEVQSLDLDVWFDGAQRQFEARHVRIDDDEAFVIVRDVSDVHSLEHDLREMNQQLEERVADRTAALARESLGRKEANEALAARAEELERVLRDARCIIWRSNITQVEGKRLIWTPSRTDDAMFRAVLPLTVKPGESYQDAWTNSILPEDKARMDTVGNRAVLSGQAGYVQTYTCTDENGSARRIREDVALRRTGKGSWEAVGVAHDITLLAEAEEVQQQIEERFQTVFHSAPLGMLIRDRASVITHANQALCDMLGYTADELRLLQPEDITDPEDWDQAAKTYIDELIDGRRDAYDVERRYTRKGGESFWVHLRVNAVRDAGGALLYAVSMFEDITERREADEAIQNHEEERTRLLQRIVDVQEEERARIAYELHDQVGQQLTSLLLGLKAAEASTRLTDMRAQAAALREDTAKAVEDVRQMAFDMRPSALDDMGVVTALRRDIEILSQTASFHAVFRAYDEDAIVLSADSEVALYRVVSAALTNTVQHARATHMSVIIQPRDGAVLATVEDDGRGFDTQAVLGGPVEARFGLLAMQERIANVGGELTFQSSVGEGSTVHITLPMQRPNG
jgi:PAS domain S-box-containing protein